MTSINNISLFTNKLLIGDSAILLKEFPANSIDLIVTSPPYWTAVTYNQDLTNNSVSYESYIDSLLLIWKECERILRPNGKIAINTPIMPIPKNIIDNQHTRHIKNINNDIEFSIISNTNFLRFSLYIWQKQTSKLMFGSYPYPGNLLENNTIEFINVFVKPGKPPKFDHALRESNMLSREEWVDLIQQVWFMYPEDIKRVGEHPAPFPLKLPGRIIRLYTYGSSDDFEGEIVLDPFCGTGTTCVAAKLMGRRYIGIDISKKYIEIAQERIDSTTTEDLLLLVGRSKHPGKDELLAMKLNTRGPIAEKKHKRDTYGRKVEKNNPKQRKFVW